jgi:hypothetical protein
MEFMFHAAHTPMKLVYSWSVYQGGDLLWLVFSSANELPPKVLGRS